MKNSALRLTVYKVQPGTALTNEIRTIHDIREFPFFNPTELYTKAGKFKSNVQKRIYDAQINYEIQGYITKLNIIREIETIITFANIPKTTRKPGAYAEIDNSIDKEK